MDPMNNQIIPWAVHHRMIHERELLELTISFRSLPTHEKDNYLNQFLIKRANLFWILEDYGKCQLDLVEVHSNGLPILFPYWLEWLMLYQEWKCRASEVLESSPSLAIFLFDWCIPHAITPQEQAQCRLFKGVAIWLSGDQEEGMNVIGEVSDSYPDMIKKTISITNYDGQEALKDKDFTKAKNLFQRSLILIQSERSQDKECKCCILNYLATAYFHLNEYQTALDKGEEAYALNPVSSHDEAERWKERAERMLLKGNFVLSIEYCSLAFKLTPKEANYANLRCTLLSCRSVAYAKTNYHEKALEDSRECLILTTTNISKEMYMKFTARGNSVLESHPSLAERFFTCSSFHAVTPFEKAQCLLYKGVAFWLSGDQYKGMTSIKEASKVYSDIIEETVLTWKKWGVKALEDKYFTKAKNLFQRSLILIQSERSQDKECKCCILNYLATAYFHLNEYQTALDKGEEAYALNPVSSHVEAERWKKRTEKISKQDSFELLTRYYTLAIKFAPEGENFGDLRFALFSSRCNTYIETNQYDQALEDAEKCLAIKPNWLTGHQLLGDIFDRLGGGHRKAVHSFCKAFSIADVPEKNRIIQKILLISKEIPDGTTDVILDVPNEMINDMIKQCLCNEDWEKLRLLFIGGGGPHKYDYGKGGLAAGCDASGVPLEMIVEWGIDNSVNYLPEFLDELLKHGAPISGSQGCDESPLEMADRRQDRGVLQVFAKYKKSQGTMWRKRGTKAYDSGHLGNAVFAFKKAIQCEMEFQERLEIHLALSTAYFERKEYQNSIHTCDKVLDLPDAKKEVPSPSIKPLIFELICLRGSAHYHLHDFQHALQDGIEATTRNPDDVKGYTLLVSCNKDLQRHDEMLSALNECLKRELNPEEQWKFLKEAIDVAVKLPEETTGLTAKISSNLLKRLHKEAVNSKDWKLIRLLYLGGGGPEKHQQRMGGIATGRVSASKIAIEDVISAKLKGKQEILSVLLEEGASVNGLNSNINPLVAAVGKGQVEIAKTLLKHNANPCVKTHGNQPLVHEVVKKAIDTENLTMLECFLDSRHPSIQNVKNSNGDSLYHLAMIGKNNPNKCKVIRCLLNANVDPTIKNKQGKLPTDCCGKKDDRRKMIEKCIKERNENCFRLLPANNNNQASPQETNKQDFPSTSKTTMVTASKSASKKIKKKDVRKELEELIENVTIINKFDEGVKSEAVELPEALNGPEEVTLARESANEEKSDAMIQEIDETKFENLLWEVDFSDKFKKRFSGKKIQQDTKERIVEKIIKLAEGEWNANSCKRLEGQPKQKRIHLFESKLTKGARILWEKTIAFSQRCSTNKDLRIYTDTIRVWDVVMDHGDLDHEIKNVVKSIERGKQCAMKVMLKAIEINTNGSDIAVTYPALYQKCEYGNRPHTELNADEGVHYSPPASSEKNEYNILKFYSFTFPVMEALLNGKEKADINFPFKVTEREHDIIYLQQETACPIILLGRSGTGKTTCCLYRLWTEFQNYWKIAATNGPQFPIYTSSRPGNCSTRKGTSESCQGASSSVNGGVKSMGGCSSETFEHFHPVFITKNDVLCNEVRKNVKELINANPFLKSIVVCNDSLPNRIQDLGETSWPLIVSSRDWLLLLDASLPGDSFFQRKPDGSLQNKIIGWGKESKHMRSLPVNGEDQKMREVQEVRQITEDTASQRHRKPINSQNLKAELTYQVFRDDFWPKMERKINKEIHPTLVWTEIRSFIKGSAEALNTPKGFLSKEEYHEIGRKRAPFFKGNRDTIYEIFKSYQKFLTSKGRFDEADLVYHLHKRLSVNLEKLPWSIHSVYVDETQDFTQAELTLLILCCRQRNRMFFTGDTAQSIMRGIAFRFDDIKTLLFNLKSYDNAINVPESLFQLTHNYRSHSGILKLASSVVKLLGRFFPQSFDKLEEDTALFDGPKPVLLESCSLSDLAMILRGNKRQTSRIEFGAHQAVLVISEEARDNMPEELKHGLVLTVYEAKGLEFDDVLIYNFFKDSQAKEEWRVVTSYAHEEQQNHIQSGATGHVEIHERNLTPTSRPLEFNYEQHKVLNSEFKLLYTAITRARVNIWFFDEDVNGRGPMFEYFQRSNLVRMNVLKDTDEALLRNSFAESSTAAEWRDQGIYYFNQKEWTLAETCFKNADDELMSNKSKALRMAQEATAKQDNNLSCAAAVALLKCDMIKEAADCLSNAGESLLLEKLYKKIGKPVKSEDATT